MSRKKGYGQFCPVAQAAEIVAERWTPLLLRELLCGSRRFNDLRKGVPLMSPSLLSQRLKELEWAGIVERKPAEQGKGNEYFLTEAGEELRPVVEHLGMWGLRWAHQKVRREDLDPGLLMWDVRRRIQTGGLPGDRTVIEFFLSGVPGSKSTWWLVIKQEDVDLCLKFPGYEIDLYVESHIRTMTDVWLGVFDLNEAVRMGKIKLDGSQEMVRSFPDWFGLSIFAAMGE